ncbi:MAG: ShlB/FhaC/HecB family hemolysin secretion/activation protein [Sulfuritalea sp.]|nr:ShlB/FhaC/HecB family hemolysin secretion/activation protein [Sulfuritalea sp.]
MLMHPLAARPSLRLPRIAVLPAALAALLLSGFAVTASAQTPSIEFESRQKADPAPAAPVPLVDRKSLAAPVSGVDKIVIKGFRFSGAQLISTEALAAELAPCTGRELAADDLHQAALAVARLYLRRGSMARVRVVAVSVAEGMAEIEIQELHIGQVRVELPADTRIAPELVEGYVTGGLEAGGAVPLARLEDGIAMLNAQPGIAAAIAIDAGSKPDAVDITVRVQDRPIVSGRVSLDNHGLREIGQDRLVLALRASNAFGLTERFGLGLEQTAGSTLIVPYASVALPKPGMRVGLTAAKARYTAKRAGAALELKGDFLSGRVFVQQRWRLAPGVALNADYSLWRTTYHDDSLFGELRRRRISGARVNLAGTARNDSGLTRFGLEIERGKADLSANAADFAADAISAQIDGSFWTLRWRLGHELVIGPGTLALRAHGQWADRNLDGTQQFALGGVAQVRAYPTAEALGDGGWIAGAEWRQAIAAEIDGRLFVDTGSIKRNAKPWADQRNRYELSGLGAGLTWRMPEDFRFSTDLARQWGGNAGRNLDGTDSDGRDSRWRLWLALSREF